MNDGNKFRLLYDGACPVCSREVLWLQRRRPDAIEALDISAGDFQPANFGLTAEQVDAALYGIREDGSVMVGMDSLREGYRLAGLGWLVAWTGWWPARPCPLMPSTAVSPETGCASADYWADRPTVAGIAASEIDCRRALSQPAACGRYS